MPRVIHRSIVLTLEIVPSGMSKCRAERATDTITRAWLQAVDGKVVQVMSAAVPDLQVYVRQLPLDSGAQIQILLCWIVLQAQRQEIDDWP
jgi:hypothetical protein